VAQRHPTPATCNGEIGAVKEDGDMWKMVIAKVLWYRQDACLPSSTSNDAVLPFKTTHFDVLVPILFR
jgi:hypothetical protein